MSEMVERVTRAICLRDFPPPDSTACCGNCGVLVEQARAAIAAMREPTETMLKCEMQLGGFGYGDDVYQANPKEVWQAMIDGALEEPPPPTEITLRTKVPPGGWPIPRPGK